MCVCVSFCICMWVCVPVPVLFCCYCFEIYTTIKICIDILILRKYLDFNTLNKIASKSSRFFLKFARAAKLCNKIGIISCVHVHNTRTHSFKHRCCSHIDVHCTTIIIQKFNRNMNIINIVIYSIYINISSIHHTYIHLKWHSILESRSQIC